MSPALKPPRARLRRDVEDMYVLEDALRRYGFARVAGADEAGRGACAGPLVVAAVVLPPGRRGRVPGLADSKLLTEANREDVYAEVMARAEARAIVSFSSEDVDRYGVGACNLAGMRRAFSQLWPAPAYALTDGFPVPGLVSPGLGVWKGDRVAACVAAASVLAKVTRDRYMAALDADFPLYGFAEHKGYGTPAHQAALGRHGPCPQHRRSYSNVAATVAGRSVRVAPPA
jgi:ribonuclease HII